MLASWTHPTKVSIPFSTNFEAEYKSIIAALKYVKERVRHEQVTVLNDNATVVAQINRKARVNLDSLEELRTQVDSLLHECIAQIKIDWVDKKHNPAGKFW